MIYNISFTIKHKCLKYYHTSSSTPSPSYFDQGTSTNTPPLPLPLVTSTRALQYHTSSSTPSPSYFNQGTSTFTPPPPLTPSYFDYNTPPPPLPLVTSTITPPPPPLPPSYFDQRTAISHPLHPSPLVTSTRALRLLPTTTKTAWTLCSSWRNCCVSSCSWTSRKKPEGERAVLLAQPGGIGVSDGFITLVRSYMLIIHI